jgi:cell wall-associated NlpC family hydrolase
MTGGAKIALAAGVVALVCGPLSLIGLMGAAVTASAQTCTAVELTPSVAITSPSAAPPARPPGASSGPAAPGTPLSPVPAATCDGGAGLPADGATGLPPGFTLPTDTQQATAVAFALRQLGKPYVFGAAGPDTYDCSGLMMAAWAAAGVRIPRVTYDQVDVGIAVPNTAAMQPGDLIFIPGSDGTVARPGHVGMYIGRGGDGRQHLVQAPQTGDVVKLSTVSSWQSEIVAIRRPVTGAGAA